MPMPMRPLSLALPICLAVGLAAIGHLRAETGPDDTTASSAASPNPVPNAPPSGRASGEPTAAVEQPSEAQVAAWRAAARALKAERADLFEGADGVLATLVLPDGQGAAAGVLPGDVLIGYGETPLDGAQQLITLTGETPTEQAVTLRWLRPASPDDAASAQALDAGIRGGRIGVGIRDLVEMPDARMQALLDAGREALNRADYPRALNAIEEGLALARETRHRQSEATFLNNAAVILAALGRHQEELEHFTQALAIARETGNRRGEGGYLHNTGNVYTCLGRYHEALEHHTQALAIHREIGDRAGEGDAHFKIGNDYLALDRYREALEHYTQARAIRREIGDRAGEGDALGNIGNVYQNLGRYQEALEHYTQALAIHREIGDRAGEGKGLTNIGNVYANLGRYNEALEHYAQAIVIAREIGDRASEGAVLGNIGNVYSNLGRYNEALEHLTQALAIRREIGNRASEGNALGNIGKVYLSLGRYNEALEHLTQALAIRREIGNRAGEGKTLSGIGSVYQSLGRYPDALERYTESLAIARETGDRAGEGAALGNIGTVYQSLGRYQEALEHITEAHAIARDIGDRASEAKDLGNIGIVYQRLGRNADALERYTQSLAINREIGDRAGEGAALSNIGVIYHNLGRYQEALEHHTEALAINREIGDRAGQGATLGNIGIIYNDLRRYQEALEHLTHSLAIAREIGDRASEAMGLVNLGLLAQTQDDAHAATDYYQQAIALQAELNAPETLWKIWHNLRGRWQEQSQPGPAIVAGKRAVNTIQRMRAASSGLDQTLQQSFLQDKEDVYRRLADLLIAQGRPAEAQQVLDMLKEREFYDYIQQDDAHDPRMTRAAYSRVETDWVETYDTLADPMPLLRQRIEGLGRIDPAARTLKEQAALARYTNWRDDVTAELLRLVRDLPGYWDGIDADRQAESIQALAEAPGNKRALLAALFERSGQPTGLLQFILLGDKVRLLLTTTEDWHTAVVEVDADTLNTEIDALRTALTDRYSDATAPAKALYTRLVAPIAYAIDAAGIETLLVHLDGKLRYIPFAALHDGERWLAERWSLVYYTAASERQRETGDGGGDWRVAGLGVSEKRGDFTPLPAVKDEIEGIVREGDADPNGVLPGRALLNADFSESALRSEATNTDNGILHIASHFSLRPGSDADSSLLLGTVGDKGAPDTLSLKALRESDLDLRHLDLVALSACNTFMGGADDSGVEIEGMGAIIQRQGARGVLASLWPVADKSTGELMQTFYRLRAERPDLSKAQALQIAQLTLMGSPQTAELVSRGGQTRDVAFDGDAPDPGHPVGDPDRSSGSLHAHPYYWAPFILMGNWM